jgi:uncharacterized GH25 family protein
MRRVASAIAFAFLSGAVALVGYAQTPSRDLRARQTGTAVIRGRVLAAGTDAPLRNSRVALISDNETIPAVFTDREGRFSFTVPAAGQYGLTIKKSGYANPTFDPNDPKEPLGRIAVGQGAVVDVGDIHLLPGAAISGRIIDHVGDPVVGVTVSAEIPSGNSRGAGPVTIATAQTDDLGEYRLGSLPGGQIFVAADAGPAILGPNGSTVRGHVTMTTVVNGRMITMNFDSASMHTYYPGVASLAEARAIALMVSDEAASIDFVIPSSPLRTPSDTLGIVPADSGNVDVTDTGALRGQVTRSDGRPVMNAVVRLSSDSEQGLPRTTVTDGQGRYEFLRLPAGRYTIMASQSDLITVQYGQRRAAEPGEPIDLAPGESRDRIDISLPSPGAITGHVVDDGGDPVEGVTVRALQTMYEAGRRRLVQAGVTRLTDDRGHYRIYGLKPGEYFVSAMVGQVTVDLPGYAPTYFPGTWNPREAQTIEVDVAQQFTGIDIALARVPTARIAGMAFDAAGNPIQGGLSLSPSRRSGLPVDMLLGARIDPNGTFEFPNVPPGEYVVQASKSRANPSTEGEFASRFITVNGTDVTGIVIRMSTGSTISGRVTFRGAGSPIPTGIEVTAFPVDLDRSRNPPATADIRPDWGFELAGISGPRLFRLREAPPGWTLKAVLLNGVDVTDMPLPFGTTSQSLTDLEVVLTDRVSELSGTVTDRRGRPATDYTVIVFASDRDSWGPSSRFLTTARPGPHGIFTVTGLPSGEYFVAAVDRMVDGEWQDPDVLESVVPGALRVTLTEGQRLSVSPRLIAR